MLILVVGDSTKYPYNLHQLRQDNPETCFPANPQMEALAEFGVYPVQPVAKPEYDRLTSDCIEAQPVQVAGKWIQTWQVHPAGAEEAARRTAEAIAQAATEAKLVGVEFEGVMCSATKEDMWGLASVAPWIQAGNSTAFEFDNGNVLVLTPENYREFQHVWATFRASFFPTPVAPV